MPGDYHEHLDADALALLAETAGFDTGGDPVRFFHGRPHEIQAALASPRADRILEFGNQHDSGPDRRLLQIAVAVHRSAEEIVHVGWTADTSGSVDLRLVEFSGQTENHRFIVGLLASFLPPELPAALPILESSASPATAQRMLQLFDLAEEVAETERPGVLRLLGDEALFAAGLFPAHAHAQLLDPQFLDRLLTALPPSLVRIFDSCEPEPQTLLDVQLLFGPVWYRMASRNLLHRLAGNPLEQIANRFDTARQFLVRVAQGPLRHHLDALYPVSAPDAGGATKLER